MKALTLRLLPSAGFLQRHEQLHQTGPDRHRRLPAPEPRCHSGFLGEIRQTGAEAPAPHRAPFLVTLSGEVAAGGRIGARL